MRLQGRVFKDGRHWLVEVPLLDAMTQGRTRKEALAMIADWVETMVHRQGFSVAVHWHRGERIEIEGSSPAHMIALMLQRQRQARGLSLAEVAYRLDAKSRNAYARYERGEVTPTIAKLDELLRAVSSTGDYVIGESGGS